MFNWELKLYFSAEHTQQPTEIGAINMPSHRYVWRKHDLQMRSETTRIDVVAASPTVVLGSFNRKSADKI